MNKRFLLALGGAALFGVLAIVVAQRYLQQQADIMNRQEEREVVVAQTDIPSGTLISESQVKSQSFQKRYVPERAVLSTKDVVGRVAVMDISAKLPVLSRNLAPAGARPGITHNLPVHMRAISVRVDEASGVAGFALPNTYVDVIAVTQPSGAGAKLTAKVILQNVKVLAYGQQTTPREEGKPVAGNTVTLEVTPEQGEKLKLAERVGGTLQLMLRNSIDQGEVATSGETGVLGEAYGKPTPNPRPRTNPLGPIPPFPQVATATPTAAPSPSPRPVVKVTLIKGQERKDQEFAVPHDSQQD